MPDLNNLAMDTDKDVFNIFQDILDDEEPTVYRQAISGPNTNIWYSPIEDEMDAPRRNHT
jgi:hypothetical protein